jgi:hypothetical protein
MSADSQQRLLSAFDMMLLPRLESDDHRVALLAACPLLAADIEAALRRTISDVSEWCRSDSKNPTTLELTLNVVSSTLRIALFRQLQNVALLKEQFLLAVAVGIRTASSFPELAGVTSQLQQLLFFVPSVGVVMDRWLDKELKKYNHEAVGRAKQVPVDVLRATLKAAFPNTDEEFIELPYGIEETVADMIISRANEDKKFRFLPLALSLESAVTILRLAPTWFEIVGARARLTPSALVGVGQPLPANPKPEPVQSGPEDLIDVLLREIINKLPEHAFLNRPLPVKVQPGVYRFGTREVTFHTKTGKLFVFRVGGYVSESDAYDFVAREFSIPVEKLKGLASGPAKAAAPSAASRPGPPQASAGMRRPMDWGNQKFLARLVRRGLKDLTWRNAWESVCLTENVRAQREPLAAPLETLQRFVEHNMAHAVRQDWARDLLYFTGKDAGSDSDLDAGGPPPTGPVGPAPGGPGHPNYKTRLCANFPMGRCTRGATCAYAHGESELRPGPSGSVAPPATQHQYYKTRICNAFLDGRCTRGAGCNYAHSEAERLSFSSGVVKRDVKSSQDIRLAAKMEARDRSSSRSRSRSRTRRSRRRKSSDDM